MRSARWLLLLTVLLSASPLTAQVTARQGTPDEERLPGEASPLTEVPSPMVLEINLTAAKLHLRPVDSVVTNQETAKFVCDKASVPQVQIRKKRARKGKVLLEIAPLLRTDWMRQDVDLTLAFLAADGKELGKRVWDDLTIGNDNYSMFVFGSQSKSPKLEVQLSEEELAALYAGGTGPSLKIIVDIQDEDEE